MSYYTWTAREYFSGGGLISFGRACPQDQAAAQCPRFPPATTYKGAIEDPVGDGPAQR